MTLTNKVFSTKPFRTFSVVATLAMLAATPALAASAPVFNSSNPASGNNGPQTSCDPEYMEAMNTRAYMEAQREIAQNQNLIFKPDSVLEYSCFGNFLSDIAKAGMFSEQVLGDDTLDGALAGVVLTSVNNHLKSNFNHLPLGGRVAVSDMDKSTAINDSFHVCKSMSGVWAEAHCADFFADSGTEAFRDFDWYANNDPRKFPSGGIYSDKPGFQACQSKVLQGKAAVAYNGRDANYVLPASAVSQSWPPNDTAYGSDADKVKTFLNLTQPKGTVTCADPIKTGIKITGGDGKTYDDAICPNPGCSYDGSSCK